MRIPQFWARATAAEDAAAGHNRSISCWRSSDLSQQDAYESALAAASRAIRRLVSNEPLGHYDYGQAPLREEVIQRFTNDSGETIAAVTRNEYGALVLSTAQVMFVDVDFPAVTAGAELKHLFGRMLGRKPPSPVAQHESEARSRVEQFLSQRPDWSVRLYRTHSGLRALVTHELFDPADAATESCMQALAADPLYVRLCKAQGSFRARLTPKPWRCGHRQAPVGWPRETPEAQARFADWLAAYNREQSRFATCRLLATLGPGMTCPEAQTIVEVHDHIARVAEPLDLA